MTLGYLPLGSVQSNGSGNNSSLLQLALFKQMQDQQKQQGGGMFGWMDPLHTMGNTLNKSGSNSQQGSGMNPQALSALLGQIGSFKGQEGGKQINPNDITSITKSGEDQSGQGPLAVASLASQQGGGDQGSNWASKTGSVAGSAATGAKLGSFAGPWGTAIGAVLGGLLGAFKK